MTFSPPPAPRLALHSQPAQAALGSAQRNPAFAPRKRVTTVQPQSGFQATGYPPSGGPVED